MALLCTFNVALVPIAYGQAPGQADLIGYLNALTAFSATFEQERFDEDGEQLERSTGDCQIKRPGRFRWNYTEPFPQLIVSDGATLWIYDPDLEQVSENVVGEYPPNSPAALLGQQINIVEQYAITTLPVSDDNYVWFELRPKTVSADFASVELAFADGNVRAMRLHDNLGQTTLLKFNEISTNISLDDAHFHFSPPPGVDVVRGAAP